MKGTANPPEPLNPVDIGLAGTSALIISLPHSRSTSGFKDSSASTKQSFGTQLSEAKGWK